MDAPGRIALVGATGRVGRHVVDLLERRGKDVVPIARSLGVDVVSGDGLAETLAGADVVIDASTPTTPDKRPAIEFFTASARNLQRLGEQAGARRIVVVSIIGIDRFTAGYYRAKQVQEHELLAGPIPVRILRAAQFHELVADLTASGRRNGVSYVPNWRTQLVAARTVANALADLATAPESAPARNGSARIPEIAGPREESLVEMARLLVARRGDRVRVEGVTNPNDPDAELYARGAQLPGPYATLAGPTFEEWLESRSAT
jgi:uncharacterized protein YbjT (DUF2867 family)